MSEQKSNTRNIKVNGYKSAKLTARREQRRIEADMRQSKHDLLTPAQKLEKAKKRGGCKREIAKLSK